MRQEPTAIIRPPSRDRPSGVPHSLRAGFFSISRESDATVSAVSTGAMTLLRRGVG